MVELDGLPPLHWLVEPAAFDAAGDELVVEAGARSDWFVDPGGAREPVTNAPALLAPVDGDFTFAAHVDVELRSTFDAAALFVHLDARRWGKLCLERSPDGAAMVVSVVTDGYSDDANAHTVAGSSIWLRIARIGDSFAFHASDDGSAWDLVRHFRLADGRAASAGVVVQSPLGPGCRATFRRLALRSRTLGDLRDGS